MSKCGLRNLDANDDTTIEWADSKIREAIIAVGSEKGDIDIKGIPRDKIGEETYIHRAFTRQG